MDHIHEKESLDHGIRTIRNDIANQGRKIDEKNYLRDGLELALFFKSLRIRLLFVDKMEDERMKFSTLVEEYGFKICATKNYIWECLLFYHIEMSLQGNGPCDIEYIG